MKISIGKYVVSLIAASLLVVTFSASAQVTNFSTDVAQSIDDGLLWLENAGAFNNPSSAVDASGLVLLALLEKRASADPNDPPQGYGNASAADQQRARNVVAYILATKVTSAPTFRTAYRDGASTMALSLYLRSGGPDRGDHPDLPAALPYDLIGALNFMFDRTLTYQSIDGYWCYSPSISGCPDSSTTQFVMAGLAALRGVYSDPLYADAARLASLNSAAAAARTAYIVGGTPGGSPLGGNVIANACDVNELGHGYNRGNVNTIQQTASGTWSQLVGGADLNDPTVQAYLTWLYNRYRYTDPANNGTFWPSYWYYLWSSSKALQFLADSGVTPDPGNLGVDDFGTLAGGGLCDNQFQRDPLTDTQVTRFGAGAIGYYDDHPSGVYYDFAHSILSYQCGAATTQGQYACGGAPSFWDNYARQSYALLVLQRSVGGGCIDSDEDGICDADDNCPADPNAGQEDGDGDGWGDVCDVCPDLAAGNDPDPGRPGCPSNSPPVCGVITLPPAPVALGDPAVVSASFTDADIPGDTHTATWDWDEAPTSAGTVSYPGPVGDGSVDDSKTYETNAGVFTISVTITDSAGETVTCDADSYIVVYDPDSGFVTGGGWIISPAGAYMADLTLTGKANFGFVSKYKKGKSAPEGSTEFQFHAGDINFHSNTYEWLVIAGHKAMYKGVGTINGAGNYGFLLKAIDAKLHPTFEVDKFNIKIWDKAAGDAEVYDNSLGAADDVEANQDIDNGQIVIHTKGKK